MKAMKLDRRQFLARTSAGLAIALGSPGVAISQAQGPGGLGPFISIAPDGIVSLTAPALEIGQGSQTALAMILCDELGAAWEQVVVAGPTLDAALNVPGRNGQTTSGSQMVRRWYQPLRLAAAQAREMLSQAASERLGTLVSELTVADGYVSNGSQRLSFGDLAEAAGMLPVPEAPELREVAGIVGKPIPRADVPAKVDGTARFGIDVRLPGMAYAAIRQAPVYGASVTSVGALSDGMDGVVAVVETAEAVMVVADRFWQAKKALDDLEIAFSEPDNASTNSEEIFAEQTALLDTDEVARPISSGDAQAAIEKTRASGGIVHQADYQVPFLYHATMEPMVCTAHIEGDTCTLWVPTQNITESANAASRISGIPFENVTVHATFAGGGFGRKFEIDFVEQAVHAAMKTDRPVQLIWSREEDVQHGYFRPAMTARMTASLAENGDVAGIVMRKVGPSVLEHTIGKALIDGSDPIAWIGFSTETGEAPGKLQQYAIDDVLAEFAFAPTHVPLGYWRAVGASESGFFIESFIDELAHANGSDPFEFRRHLLRNSPRGLAVLEKVAAEAGWGGSLMPGHFQGIAFSECVGSHVAQVCELSIEDGRPVFHRIVAAIDCGTAVNPDSVDAQVRGAIVMALSAALSEQITISDGRCEQSNFHDYPVLKMGEIPPIDVHILNSGAPIGGVGEAGVPSTAPAVTNAIFAATGKRIRTLPILENL